MAQTVKHVVVVGGGLAGMACAVALAEEEGIRVTLLEARHALGGRASSFEEEREGGGVELLDNCQHVLLGCCTNLLDLYRRMGVSEKVVFDRRVHFLDAAGRGHDLWGMGRHGEIPAPLHLSLSMMFFSALTVRERVAVVRAMMAMMRMGKSGRDKLEGMAFGEWLDLHGQPASVVTKFYDPVLISALNEETRRASAKYAIQVFQDALLANSRGYLVGLPACPLGELYAGLPEGVEVRVGARVEEVMFEMRNAECGMQNEGGTENTKHETRNTKEEESVRAVGVRLRGGEEIRGDAVVVATNYHAVMRWVAGLGAEVLARDGRFAGLAELESVPILGVHMWFDRAVMRESSAALIAGPGGGGGNAGGLQWLFRKDKAGRQLHGVISAARGWEKVAKEEALQQFEGQVRSLFPQAREAKLLRGVIVIEKRATFSPLPGVDRLRPSQGVPAGGIEGLYLAGDYTKMEWPATMEGAVRSGYLAAEGILRGWGREAKILVGDLKVQWPGRLMGLHR